MKVTTDHDEIRDWAERHGGTPQRIDHQDAKHDRVGIRIDFNGVADEVFLSADNPPAKISWEEFFNIFEEQMLAFEYEEETNDAASAYRFTNRAESEQLSA